MTNLNRDVYVLNKSWIAVGVVSLKKAIGMLFSEPNGEPKARIIDPTQEFRTYTWADWYELRPKEGEPFIRTIDRECRIPRMILLSRYEKIPKQNVCFNRRAIFKRDNYQCCYCGSRPETSLLNIDHVIPRHQGGQTNWENCVVSCFTCNAKKANKTPEQAGMKLLKKPFKPKFNLIINDRKISSWHQLLSEAYWSVELENDINDEC